MPTIVIAAGGTAGHVVPALAVADALSERGADVEFIGGERAEAELVPAAGYPFHALRVAGIDRSNPLRAARAALLAARATGRARRLLRQIGADAVLGGGGYVAGPVGLAAKTRGLPLVLTEADSHLGVSNRMLAPFAARVCLAFPIEGRRGAKWLVTGRPVPRGTEGGDQAAARARLGVPPDGPCLLVFGGSLGARRLNDAALDAFGAAAPCSVLHAAGRRDYDALRARLDAARLAAALPAAPVRRAVRGRPGRRGPRRRARGRLGVRAGRRGPARRSSCRIRTRPATTRRRTPASWSAPARPS